MHPVPVARPFLVLAGLSIITILVPGCTRSLPSPKAHWQTWKLVDGKRYVPQGLYQDEACTQPAVKAGDIVKTFRDESNPTRQCLVQSDAQQAPTLQFVSGRPVLRFDGIDDYLHGRMNLPLSGLNIWVRYKINRPRATLGDVQSVFAGHAYGGFDSSENGFALPVEGPLRSTSQNVMQVTHLQIMDGKSSVYTEGIKLFEEKTPSGTASEFILGGRLQPNPQGFLAMDVDNFLIEGDVPEDTFSLVDKRLGSNLEKPRLVCLGDSLTDGSHGTSPNSLPSTLEYPSQLQLLRPQRFVINCGQWGFTLAGLQPVDDLYTPGAQMVLFIGSNDITIGRTAGAFCASLAQFCQAHRTKGWKVYVTTLLPRITPSNVPDWETKRLTVNTRIRNSYKTFADGIIDFGGDPRIGKTGSEKDSFYYTPDQVHLKPAGAKILAQLVNEALPEPNLK